MSNIEVIEHDATECELACSHGAGLYQHITPAEHRLERDHAAKLNQDHRITERNKAAKAKLEWKEND
ncbi:MAG: hypothetical protein ACP5I8_15265 [Phycisphaerae bacterium]